MKFTLLTLFPEMFTSVFDKSIIKRGQDKKIIDINLINIRDYSTNSYQSVDDHPYGGGAGMVMKVDVIDKAVESAKLKSTGLKVKKFKERIILLDPRGKKYDQQIAKRLIKYDHLVLVCGHYEGVDERVKKLVDESISIGDYVLTGGEIPAMVIVDSVTRLIPGVLKKAEATLYESFQYPISNFSFPVLEYPQYTRPPVYKNMKVPKILLSGNHKSIAEWRKKQSEKLTRRLRPKLRI